MKNEKTPQMVQAECDACDQILTLDESPIGLTLCIACAKEYETDLDTLNLCEWAEPDWSFSDDLLTEADCSSCVDLANGQEDL